MKTPHELARAISALINSKPRSPTIEELEGVIWEHWSAPSETAGAKPLITYDSEKVARGIQQMRDWISRLEREEFQTAEEAQRFREASVSDDYVLLDEIVECVDELRGSEEPLNRELASRLLEILQDVGVVQKPPMIAVVEPTRDSISLGGVVYTRVVEAGCAPDAKPISMTGVAAHLKPKLAKVSLGSVPDHVFIKKDGIIPGPVFYGSWVRPDGESAA